MISRLTSVFIASTCGYLSAIASAAGPVDDAQRPPSRTLIFVDDHDVLYRSGTTRFLHPAQRRQRTPLVAQEKPWELAIGWTSVYRDQKSGKYQLWYQGYGGVEVKDKRMECVVCYAESDDGLKFTKPKLQLFPFEGGHAKTNIVLIGNGGYGDRYCNSVLVDDGEKDPQRRYKMAYYDWSSKNGREEAGLHVAFSPDGVHWTKHPDGPLYRTGFGGRGLQPPYSDESPYAETPLPGKSPRKVWSYPLSMSDAADVFYDPHRQVFAIYGKSWIDSPLGGHAWKHAMSRTESKDFLSWSRPEFVLGPDDLDASDIEFHTSPVFFYNDCYFSLNQILNRRGGGSIDLELMTSRDGLKWDRSLRDKFFLDRGDSGAFDSRALFSNSTPVILDDEIRFYYGAYSQSPIGGVSATTKPQSGVGMASIPRDRFAGIRPVAKSDQPTLRKPVENIGQVTLKAIDIKGYRKLTLNADAANGSIRVEILNADGYRVRGYSQDDCTPLTGDSLRHPAEWTGGSLAGLPPGKYMLRLHLNNAAVYAVTFKE